MQTKISFCISRTPGWALLVLLSSLLVGCEQEQAQNNSAAMVSVASGDELLIYTVNYPLAYFAERIGAEDVNVVFPVPGDVDPAFWLPTPDDILGFQGADLIMLNGAGYAQWIGRATLPEAALVDTSAAISDLLIEETDSVRHRHGPEGDHSHGELAFTTWLDADLAAMQARAIQAAMAQARPELAPKFSAAGDSLVSDLKALDQAATAAFAKLTGANIIFSHPVYQYLQRKYELAGQTVLWEPNEPLSATAISALAAKADAGASAMNLVIWEAEPLAANRAALREIGYTSVVFKPLANRADEGDYLAVMLANLDRLNDLHAGKDTEDN
jgi:zinc transport system substrate-binding protein